MRAMWTTGRKLPLPMPIIVTRKPRTAPSVRASRCVPIISVVVKAKARHETAKDVVLYIKVNRLPVHRLFLHWSLRSYRWSRELVQCVRAREMLSIARRMAVGLSVIPAALVAAQFPPTPEGFTVLESKFGDGVQILYKEVRSPIWCMREKRKERAP
jgi:hypothetical protein